MNHPFRELRYRFSHTRLDILARSLFSAERYVNLKVDVAALSSMVEIEIPCKRYLSGLSKFAYCRGNSTLFYLLVRKVCALEIIWAKVSPGNAKIEELSNKIYNDDKLYVAELT